RRCPCQWRWSDGLGLATAQPSLGCRAQIPAQLEGRRGVKPSRVGKASYRLAVLTSLLLSMALLLQPIIADGADGDTTTTLAMPRADAGSQEPSSGGPVILRGTRPVSPVAAEAPNVGNQASAPPY